MSESDLNGIVVMSWVTDRTTMLFAALLWLVGRGWLVVQPVEDIPSFDPMMKKKKKKKQPTGMCACGWWCYRGERHQI